MLGRQKKSDIIFNMVNSILLVFVALATLYPILHVLFASFSDAMELMKHKGLMLWPQGFSLVSYRYVLGNKMVMRGYLNTIFVVLLGTFTSIVLTSICAYVLSRKNFFWRTLFTQIIIFTMFFSGGIIPLFLIVRSVGLLDTRLSMIIPYLINAYNMIIIRTFFTSIPDSLEESAKMEGASHFQIIFKIMIPLAMPVIAVMILYYGVYYWNSWFPAMMYIRNRTLYPLQLAIREILIDGNTSLMVSSEIEMDEMGAVDQSIKYATIMVATIPVLCIYPFLQKYFIKGVMIGSVKG